MTESKHTPGAIRAAYDIVDSASKYRIENDRERWVDEIARIIDRETTAPELLEACEAALSWVPQLRQWQGDHPDIGGASLEALTRTLRTAIAHARGEDSLQAGLTRSKQIIEKTLQRQARERGEA